MAEIKIEKKKPVWPWIIALLLIGAVVYYVFLRDTEPRSETTIEVENAVPVDSTTAE
ncbi:MULTISPECIES: hypothetical protein [Flavobacterium]|uniref:Uncharacterized protein n=1 Tax=Flavobacterium endoglycinae TaxID=2816357 RepID=A0ABX7QEI3_9FLAO|nr:MULTISPECIES: hypothetical protein [Flavobacterium]QSW88913.1 hypothetical protein J0383_22070 [Flavobacterium endoglycinae]